jgi:hypothetical protein
MKPDPIPSHILKDLDLGLHNNVVNLLNFHMILILNAMKENEYMAFIFKSQGLVVTNQ